MPSRKLISIHTKGKETINVIDLLTITYYPNYSTSLKRVIS